jgi:hypothetical protein
MELDHALENIKELGTTLAKKEIQCIREHKEEAIPLLLRYVQDIANNPNKYLDSPENCEQPIYAMFLLAEFRVNDALESFIQMLELDGETAYSLLEEMITESSGRVIASVAHEKDIDRIKLVIENTEVDEFQRIAALKALITMYFTGAYSKEELLPYLGYVLHLASESYDNKSDIFITFVVYFCQMVDAKEHFPFIMELYDKWMIDTSVIQPEEFTKEVSESEREAAFESHKSQYTFIDDAIKEMEWWYDFKPKTESSNAKPPGSKKVGRNDPFLCGSGKKYKKCCLNKG